jgi:hypothetical protein
MHDYKRRPLPFVCSCPHRCLPLVSRPSRASPPFLPLRRCQATSRAFRPRVQVPEHPPTSEKLPDAWLTSPTTGATRHRRRTLVTSTTASPSYSDALPLTFSYRAGAWDSHDTVGEHLPVIRPLGACCRSRHGGALCAHHRVSSEPRALPRALRPGRRRWLVGHASRPPVRAGQAARRMSRAMKAAIGPSPVPILARWPHVLLSTRGWLHHLELRSRLG